MSVINSGSNAVVGNPHDNQRLVSESNEFNETCTASLIPGSHKDQERSIRHVSHQTKHELPKNGPPDFETHNEESNGLAISPFQKEEKSSLPLAREEEEGGGGGGEEIRVFTRRWLVLLIFSLYSLGSAYQWIHMNIIANVILRIYNDSLPQDSLQRATAVDWLSMVYFLSYVLAFLPVLWILDSKGLRISVLIGTALNVTGTGLKVAAVNSDLFALALAAQTLCGLAEVYVLPMPPRLAAVWFGADQVSTACSLGVLANQIGVAVGFLLPPFLVPDSPSLEDVTANFRYMMIGGAVYSVMVFVLAIFGFRDKPACPPSRAQFLIESTQKATKYSEQGFVHSLVNYKNSLLRLLKNRNFMLLLVAYGLNTGSFYAISTLLNNVVLFHHPGEQTSAGRIGLTIVLAGVVSSLVAGVWLDKTHTFKATSVILFALTVLGMVSFTFTLNLELWIIYITAGSLGFFMTGILPVAYQFAAEITYPEPEGSSSGLLTASAMFFGIVMTLGMRAMMNQVSILAANIFVSCVLLIGTIMTAAVRPQYLRQNAENSVHRQEMEVGVPLQPQ